MRTRLSLITNNLTIILITIAALVNRIWNLSQPKGYIFDEVYYVKNANSLIRYGVELSGQPLSGEFIVHPPLGKWLIGVGIQIFGNNEFGWRISAAVFGTALIPLIYLIALRLFKSSFIANICALLLAVDGLALVMSRTALLDIFLTFFLVLAVLFWLQQKHALAGISIGLAGSVKWNGAFIFTAIFIFALYKIYVMMKLKEFDFVYLLVQFRNYFLIPLITYVLSWSGWFFTSTGWKRNNSTNPLLSLWNYHLEILSFHRNLTQAHPYSANPFGWLWLRRPTSFYFESETLGKSCGANKCAQEILALGTPVLWWIAGVSLFLLIYELFRFKTKLAILVLAPITSLYLPWLLLSHRTTFYFYSITFLPFLILAVGYLINRIKNLKPESELFTLWLPITIVAIIAANYLYFLPIFMGLNIPYAAWLKLMWLKSWI